MSKADCLAELERQLVLFEVDRREVTVAFDGGEVVTDTGLLAVRKLDRELGILAEAAARLPDPRSELTRVYSTAELLSQKVYQLLGGYFDSNDAQLLRHDPALQTVLDRIPGSDSATLASGSTLARFNYGFTRREQSLPVEERTIEQECQKAKLNRLKELNRFLVELFIKTRSTPPREIVLDIDTTDDPTHGGQQLSLFNAYYKQHQLAPLLVFEGNSKLPLAGWLRTGTAHASWGAVETLQELVTLLREAWPEVEILVRADTGYAVPAVYEFCETHGVKYVIGYGANNVLKARTQLTLDYVEALAKLYDEPVRQFQEVRGYQAESWDRPRRVIAKCEVTAQGGTNRRFVVTNLTEPAETLYSEIYVKRGDGAERPIQELKHGLAIDRLSSHRFFANAFQMQCHLLAYALFVLFREANAEVPEVAEHTLETVRSRVFKVGAVVQVSTRKIWFHASASWPGRDVFARVCAAVDAFSRHFGRLWWDRTELGLDATLGMAAAPLK